MGGEQYAVLVYGPKITLSVIEWIDKFNLVNKKEWVKNFMQNEWCNREPIDFEDPEEIKIVYDEEIYDYSMDILDKFLKQNKLDLVYDNNVSWEEPYIGVTFDDYDLIDEETKNKMKNFCNKYSLPEPKIYAGINGEFE